MSKPFNGRCATLRFCFDGDQSARPGISGCLHGTDGPLLLGRVQAPGAPIATGAHAEIAVGIGVGGGLPEHELHRLDPPQATGEPRLAVEEIPAAAAAVMPRPHLVRLSLPAQGTPQQLLPARLKNPHAVCYLNACSQALCWLGMLTAALQACFGLAQAAFKPLLHAGRPYLPIAAYPGAHSFGAGGHSVASMTCVSLWRIFFRLQSPVLMRDYGSLA